MKPAASIAQLERLLRSGLQAQAAGRLDEASGFYGRALALHPSCADALHLLGQARFLAQRADEALGLVDRAIAVAPATPSYLNTRGVILRALDRATEAIASFRAAIALDARHAGARKNLAGGLASTGAATGEVAAAYVAAAALAPQDPECWLGAAQALDGLGRHSEAAAAAERATALDPGSAACVDAWFAAARAAGGLSLMEERLAPIVAANPGRAEVAMRLVDVRVELGQPERAEEGSLALVARAPADARAWQRRGVVLQETGREEEAIAAFKRALELAPGDDVSDQRIANCLVKLDRDEEALERYRGHLGRFPHIAVSWSNAAIILCRLDRDREALAFFDRAVDGDPGLRIARASRAMARMRLGMLREGWDDYRFREARDEPYTGEAWPSSLAGRRIHVRAEQGVGDQLYFLRFARLAAGRGAELTVDVVGKLAGMARRAGFVVSEEAPEGAQSVFMGDLPWLLGCGDDDFPPPFAIEPLPESVARARELLAGLPRPIVGATWRAGGVRGKKDTIKLVPPAAFGAALRGATGSVVSLQRLPEPGETEAFSAALGRDVLDLSACNDDLELMLALMAQVDAYAGVSNANLHLRCAVGLPSDILVTFPLDWRWMRAEGGFLPWYPGCRSYRQAPAGGWTQALEELAAAARGWRA